MRISKGGTACGASGEALPIADSGDIVSRRLVDRPDWSDAISVGRTLWVGGMLRSWSPADQGPEVFATMCQLRLGALLDATTTTCVSRELWRNGITPVARARSHILRVSHSPPGLLVGNQAVTTTISPYLAQADASASPNPPGMNPKSIFPYGAPCCVSSFWDVNPIAPRA